jgi:starch synthase
VTFDVTSLEGKAACKEALQQECDLQHQQVPLFGMISRLDVHKGLDLMIEVIPELLQLDVQLVILGNGQPEIEERLAKLARTHPGKMALRLGFDTGLAHRILAGADLFVMPSRFEPCGLSQMYSMRYGTIPVVRRTGGLADTVVDYLPSTIKAKTATGFHFVDVTGAALLKALLLASTVYASTYRWRQLVETAMAVVFGWGTSAEAYVRLYRSLERHRREER